MEVLAEAGGPNLPEFFGTHPNPADRFQRIEATIEEDFPNGVPTGLAQ